MIFYLSFIGWYGFVGPDEPRYARIAEEMMHRGDWVLPTLKGSAWLEKPPLLYWMANVSYRVFGVNEFAARLPAVLLALGAIATLYLTLKRTFGEPDGLQRIAGARHLRAVPRLRRRRHHGHAVHRMRVGGPVAALAVPGRRAAPPPTLLWAAGAVFGLAVLAKGPLGLVLPVLAVYPYLMVTGRVERLTLPRPAVGALALLGGGGALVHPRVPAGGLLLHPGVLRQSPSGPLFHFDPSPHPAVLLLPAGDSDRPPPGRSSCSCGGTAGRSGGAGGRTRGPTACCSSSPGWRCRWCSFSLSSAKLPGYILPLFPALAVLIG